MSPKFLCSSLFRVVFAGSFYLLPVEINAAYNKYVYEVNNNLLAQDINNSVPVELKLFADRQYDLSEKLFVAEGNVKAYLKGATLQADRMEFDRSNKVLKAKGRVIFNKGSQYFQADSMNYDFIKGSGDLNNVYGVLAIDSLANDLKLISSEDDLNGDNKKIINNRIKEIKLNDGYNIKGGNIESKFNSILKGDSIQGSINKWRFQSPKINITNDGWFAEKIIFTNDPLNPAQTKIEAVDVKATEGQNQSGLITFKKSRLILEDKVSIPLLGKRKFGDAQKLSWVIGYDVKEKDGLFIGRQFEPMNLGNNFEFSFQPQFFIQRAVRGKTNSYIANGEHPLSKKIVSKAKTSDIFGIESNLKGSKSSWDIDFTSLITTFEPTRFVDGLRYYGELKKDLDFNDIKLLIYTSYRYKNWNGSLGDSDIYYSSGIFLDKSGDLELENSNHEYNIRIGTGHYEAESFNQNILINQWRNHFKSSIRSRYPIYRQKNNEISDLSIYRYSPVPVSSGLDFNTKISTSYSLYNHAQGQTLFKLAGGPELTLGNYKKKYLDFTRLSIMPGMTIKDGSSPFKFDNDVDLRTITLELDQQLYGPLLISTGLEYNIDKDSDNYGKSLSSQLAIIVKRRSYGLGVFYQPYQKAGGVMFSLNGFSFNQSGEIFDINQ